METATGNLFQCAGYDVMHTELMGVWLDLMQALKAFTSNTPTRSGALLVRKINEALQQMPRHAPQ